MTNSFYSDLLTFFKKIGVKYNTEGNFIRFEDSKYSLYLVHQNEDNSVDHFFKMRTHEQNTKQRFLVFIWYDLWLTKPAVILSKITHLLGLSEKVHARKTKAVTINKIDSQSFIDTNHLNQPATGYKRIGLTLNNELVAVATFAKRRKFRDNTYSAELLQFATQNNLHINGGLSKLIQAFKKTHTFDSLMTYIDLDWSNGDKFSKIGFKIHSIKPPVYYKPNIHNKRIETSKEQTYLFNLGSIKSIQ